MAATGGLTTCLADSSWGGGWPLSGKQVARAELLSKSAKQQGAASQPCSGRGGARGAWLKEASGLLQSLLPACCQLAPPPQLHLSPHTTSSPWAAAAQGAMMAAAGSWMGDSKVVKAWRVSRGERR